MSKSSSYLNISSDLPDDVLGEILNHLNIRELVTFCITNKDLANRIYNISILWKKLLFPLECIITDDNMIELFTY